VPVERIYILCEGETEEAFTNLVLAPHFEELGVWSTTPIIPKRKSGIRMGGWNSYQSTKHFWSRFILQYQRPTVLFSSLLDLYAIPQDFPGLAGAPGGPPGVRVRALEQNMEADFQSAGAQKFFAHLQLHEYEALLLVDCGAIGAEFPNVRHAAQNLRASIAGLAPEEVDEHPDTAPSKRIVRVIPQYAGLKSSAGPIIASSIGLPQLRASCPHFHDWLTRIEAAATL